MANQEIERSAKAVGDHLQQGELGKALTEFQQEMIKLERNGGNRSANEADYMQALLKQNDELKSNGFPGFHLTQDGQRLTMTAEVKLSDGRTVTQPGYLEWTSYTKEHGAKGHHEITHQDFMKAMAAKLDTSPQQHDSAQPGSGDNSNMLHGKVDEAVKVEQHKASDPVTFTDPYKSGLESGPVHAGGDHSKPVSDYPQPHMIQSGADRNQFQQFARNSDGTLNFEQLSNGCQGPILSGGQRWTNYQQGYFVDTQIQLPANTPPGEVISGHLPSGDPIQGRVVTGRDGRPHFQGWTTPNSTGHGNANVRLDIKLD